MKKLFPNHILRGVVLEASKHYFQNWTKYVRAVLAPTLLIAIARFMTTDYTGDQYAVIIALISAFISLALARIAVAGWDRRKVGLMSLYNALMSRYLSAVGLLATALFLTLPALIGFLGAGVAIVGDLARWSLILFIPVLVFGVLLTLSGSFALLALCDDMSLKVMQTFRVSFRLTRRFLWPLVRLVFILAAIVIVGFIIVSYITAPLVEFLQDLRWQIVLDGVVSLVVSPFIFSLWSRVYNRMVENYE